MRALTVRQPWAWAIIHGGKDVENRSRNLAGAYRGSLAIHAAVFWSTRDIEDAVASPCFDRTVLRDRRAGVDTNLGAALFGVPLQLGTILGVVDLTDVHDYSAGRCHRGDGVEILSCSPWAQPGHRHLVLANPRPLAHPIPWRGLLGLWPVPADLEAQIRAGVTP